MTDVELASIAARQHGIVTTWDLASCGIDSRMTLRRVAAGRLHPVWQTVYAVGCRPTSTRARWMAATLRVRGNPAHGNVAALSHMAAAELLGILRGRARRIDVVARRRIRSFNGVTVHESRTLEQRDLCRVDGIWCTNVPRTLLDLAGVLDIEALLHVMHEAAYRRGVDEDAIRDVISRNRGGRAARILEEALAMHLAGQVGRRSGLEGECFAVIRTNRRPLPLVNAGVVWRDEEIEVDLFYPDRRLVIEVDGPPHLRARTRIEDHRRMEKLAAAGCVVLRVTMRDIRRAGGRRVIELLDAALAATPARPNGTGAPAMK